MERCLMEILYTRWNKMDKEEFEKQKAYYESIAPPKRKNGLCVISDDVDCESCQ